jgi:hypothetical protein
MTCCTCKLGDSMTWTAQGVGATIVTIQRELGYGL